MSALTSSWTPRILSLLRIVTGYLLLTHGTAKILGFPKVDMFANLQIGSIYGIAGILELILGVLLVIGLFSRFAAFIASGLCAFAYFIGHASGSTVDSTTSRSVGSFSRSGAVAAGTMLAAEVSQRMHMISEGDVERIRKLYLQAGLPTVAPNLGTKKYLHLMGLDKKVEGGKLRFVLLKRIGEAVVRSDVPAEMLARTLVECTHDA